MMTLSHIALSHNQSMDYSDQAMHWSDHSTPLTPSKQHPRV